MAQKKIHYCTISFSTYDTDLRVKRYAEAMIGTAETVQGIGLANGVVKQKVGMNKGVTVYYADAKRDGEKNRSAYFINLLKFAIKATFILLKNQFRFRYSIIHVHNLPDFLVFVTIIPKLLGTKVILDIHDIMPELYCERFKKPITSLLAKTMFCLEKISLHYADYVVVANELWRKKLITRTGIQPQKCTSILNYPNLSYYKAIAPDPARKELRLVYPGHLSYHHGLDIAIKAFSIVLQQVPDAQFNIYARTWVVEYRKELEALISKSDLGNNVLFHAAVSPEEIPKVYNDATIGVVPKRGGLFAGEAFSSKIFDFMAAGLPIVASKTPVDEYYFDDSMLQFFAMEDVDDMAQKILDLYHNPKRRVQLAENGKKFAAANNWEDKKKEYVAIVGSLLKKGSR